MKRKNETFREWRKRLGLSVEGFAKDTRLSFTAVSKYDVFPERRPREVYRRMIARKFPDCPLVNNG